MLIKNMLIKSTLTFSMLIKNMLIKLSHWQHYDYDSSIFFFSKESINSDLYNINESYYGEL